MGIDTHIQQGCRQSPHPRTHVTTKMARATGGQIRKKKGEAGAAKNYITRTQAIKKLQCSMADFRRLCILKGIFPRQPKSTKKANKGSTAPASFYYIKDIQYLLHEPVLQKLRQYKTFSKKLSKAVGRGEWTTAKSLEVNQKPKYRLDHIIKERYPSFPDALRDLDDALSLIVLFAHLPASEKVPASIIANCSRLAAEWQLYVMKTRSLSKVFLSIKGIYFQAIVKGETVTWLVPYMFTQNVPTDIDFRIMMTFLELYQTLLGFTFYKLYSDINLVYPPKFDTTKDDEGAGIGALLLEETSRTLTIEGKKGTEEDIDKVNAGKKVTAKDVKKQIRSITHHGAASTADQAMVEDDSMAVEPSSASLKDDLADVPQSTEQGGQDVQEHDTDISDLFSNYYFYLSREVTRPTLEFVIRSFGGQVGWDDVLGAGSPYSVNDPRITHHIVDRPVPTSSEDTNAIVLANLPGKRAFIQPQWVVDCINKRKLLPTGPYGPGQILPPHLSPFVDDFKIRSEGGYVPNEAEIEGADVEEVGDEVEGEEESDEEEEAEEEEFAGFGDDSQAVEAEELDADASNQPGPALLAAAANPDDSALLHAAELEAESKGVPHSQFQAELAAESKKAKKASAATNKASAAAKKADALQASSTQESNPASILLSNKQRKLYNKMKYGENKRQAEHDKLREKKKAILKEEKKGGSGRKA